MKINGTSLKIFLTSGVCLTKNHDERIYDKHGNELSFEELMDIIHNCIERHDIVVFSSEIKSAYMEDDVEKTQLLKHHYQIPVDKISWYMVEEV